MGVPNDRAFSKQTKVLHTWYGGNRAQVFIFYFIFFSFCVVFFLFIANGVRPLRNKGLLTDLLTYRTTVNGVATVQ